MTRREESNARTCAAKVGFNTRKAAREAVAKARRRTFPGAERVVPYKCTACGMYHVGRKRVARRRALRRQREREKEADE